MNANANAKKKSRDPYRWASNRWPATSIAPALPILSFLLILALIIFLSRGDISPAPVSAGPPAQLTITAVDAHGATKTTQLSCGRDASVGGDTLKSAYALCATLGKLQDGLLPSAGKKMVCFALFDPQGPEKATIMGTIDGKQVAQSFTRTNSCWEKQWQAAAPLLPIISSPAAHHGPVITLPHPGPGVPR